MLKRYLGIRSDDTKYPQNETKFEKTLERIFSKLGQVDVSYTAAPKPYDLDPSHDPGNIYTTEFVFTVTMSPAVVAAIAADTGGDAGDAWIYNEYLDAELNEVFIYEPKRVKLDVDGGAVVTILFARSFNH